MTRPSVSWLLSALLLTATKLNAASISLPLSVSGDELGAIPVVLKGMDVSGVALEELYRVLGSRVSHAVWEQLKSQSTADTVSLAALKEAGLDITFDTSTLSLSLQIAPSALGDIGMDFGGDYQPFVPTPSSGFSWLNSFNLSHTQNWQADDSSQTSSLEWLAQMNLGGADGINLLMANYLDIDDEETNVQRGEWQLFYDNPYAPYRLAVGDVEALGAGHLSGASLGGFAFSSDYAALQPTRVIGPNSNQELVLKESADIEVWVNGQMIFSGRQDAGRLNLANLPMANGANDIEVRVRYLSGQTETFIFTQFYNTNLLNEGMVNYGVFFGQPSTFGDDGVEYTNSWLASSFIEYGLNSWLTLGGNGAVAKYGQVLGVTATVGSPWGNISTRLSFSNHDAIETGNSVSVSFESAVPGSSDGAAPNLRLSAEFSDDFNSTPWDFDATSISFSRYLASYTWTINSNWYLSLSGSHYSDNLDEKKTSATSLVNWRNGNMTIGAGVNYISEMENIENDTQFFITFDYRWNHAPSGINLGGNYNSNNNVSRLDLSRTASDYVGSLGGNIQLESDDQRQQQSAELIYVANRVRFEADVIRSDFSGSEESYSASVRMNTAVGLVDGQLGWGRGQTGPFVVANMHPTLSKQEALLGVNSLNGYKASADGVFGGLLPLDLAYSNNDVDINVPDAPVGYDWGASRYSYSPGAATGHLLTLGSDSAYTVKGILLDAAGQPVSYLQGEFVGEDTKLSFFTNRTGRFYVQGVAPGTYKLIAGGASDKAKVVTIIAEEASLIDIGTITLK